LSSIFLSHSHADKAFARRLATDLRKSGHAVWIDEAEINIGDSLIEKIREGLDQVDYVAAILSPDSIKSRWVTRELDIASNREIDEKRVVVLPILVKQVELPGFLKGKFYGNFTDLDKYDEKLALLLRSLGPTVQSFSTEKAERAALLEQLALAEAVAAKHQEALKAHQKIALRGKSPEMVEAIRKANETHPAHAPVNITTAFEVGSSTVTLDYLLWAIGKSERRGSHPLELLIDMEDKWTEVNTMLGAYADLLKGGEPNQ
jgi:TIR domain